MTDPVGKCRYCRSLLVEGVAYVCKECGRHQSRFFQYLGNYGILVSLGLLFVSYSQLSHARSERNDAQRALARVEAAESNINILAQSVIDISLSANKYPPSLYYAGDDGHREKLKVLLAKAVLMLEQLNVPKDKQPVVINEVQNYLDKNVKP